jgi:hypothetical protein
MNSSQKTVARGVAAGISSMVLLVTGLSLVLPAPGDLHTLAERIAFAVQLNVIAALPLFAMLMAVANSRFLSEAIDPLAKRETAAQLIDGRVAANTLEQGILFLVATLALSTVLPPAQLQVLTAMTIVYVLARIVFWFGYRLHPLYRAPGMAATTYINLGALVAAAILAFF